VVVADENNCIGKDNKLLCHLPADLKFFKTLTWGHTLIMGRKTFESINSKALPGRETIVISRNLNYKAEACFVASSIEQALELAKPDRKIFIVGGSEIFKLSISIADKIYLTRIHHKFECDSFFPEISPDEWMLESEENFLEDEKNPFPYSFLSFMRMNS
jgi:dihydrofolate reductase